MQCFQADQASPLSYVSLATAPAKVWNSPRLTPSVRRGIATTAASLRPRAAFRSRLLIEMVKWAPVDSTNLFGDLAGVTDRIVSLWRDLDQRRSNSESSAAKLLPLYIGQFHPRPVRLDPDLDVV